MLGKPRHRAVIDDLAALVTPGCVHHLPNGKSVRIARHHAIDQPGGIATAHDVLEKGRDVDERRRIADGVVLVLVMCLEGAYRVVPSPITVVQALSQRERALVERGSDWHVHSMDDGCVSRSSRIRR